MQRSTRSACHVLASGKRGFHDSVEFIKDQSLAIATTLWSTQLSLPCLLIIAYMQW